MLPIFWFVVLWLGIFVLVFWLSITFVYFIVRNSKPLKGVADMKNYFIIYNQNIQG